MAREVYVDQDECTSCELCVDELPEVFEMSSDGVSSVHNSSGASEDKIQEYYLLLKIHQISFNQSRTCSWKAHRHTVA